MGKKRFSHTREVQGVIFFFLSVVWRTEEAGSQMGMGLGPDGTQWMLSVAVVASSSWKEHPHSVFLRAHGYVSLCLIALKYSKHS